MYEVIGIMEQKKKITFPKGFFTKPRPTMTSSEALKDVEPFKWSKDVLKGRKKAILYPVKQK